MNADADYFQDDSSAELLAGWTLRALRLVAHYSDPNGPAYGNRSKAAELAEYKKGRPGSNQLAVTGHRIIAKARNHPGLAKLLIQTDCTLQRALERVSACLDAKAHRVLVTKDGQIVHVVAGDNHAVQLAAAKVVMALHGLPEQLDHQLQQAATGDHLQSPTEDPMSGNAVQNVAAGEANQSPEQDVPNRDLPKMDGSTTSRQAACPNSSGTTSMTSPTLGTGALLHKVNGAKSIASQINPADVVTLVLRDTYREYEQALEQQKSKVFVDVSKIRHDLCAIAGILMKLTSPNAAVQKPPAITVPGDLAPEEEQLQHDAETLHPPSRISVREVVAAEEDVIRARIELAQAEAAAVSEATGDQVEEDENLL